MADLRRLASGALVLAFAGACAGAPPLPPAPPKAPVVVATAAPPPLGEDLLGREERAGPRRRALLEYQLNGRRFPLPVLRGAVAGVPTAMLVDTGANSHVIAGWLARKAKLQMRKLGELGTDHAGRAIATYRVEEARLTVDGWGSIGDGAALVADVPEMLERMGIGAFLSPQQLPGAGNVLVLDLARGELHEATLEAAAAEIARRGRPLATHGVRPCIDDASAFRGLAYVLPALVEGSSAQLLLDTGAQRTDVLAPSPVGRGLAARSVANKEQMYAASGKLVTRTVRNANVRIGDFTTTVDVDIVPGAADAVCPRDGVVSMDVLRHCVLVLGQKDVMGRCEP